MTLAKATSFALLKSPCGWERRPWNCRVLSPELPDLTVGSVWAAWLEYSITVWLSPCTQPYVSRVTAWATTHTVTLLRARPGEQAGLNTYYSKGKDISGWVSSQGKSQRLPLGGGFTDTLPARDLILLSIYGTGNSCNSDSFCNVLMFLPEVWASDGDSSATFHWSRQGVHLQRHPRMCKCHSISDLHSLVTDLQHRALQLPQENSACSGHCWWLFLLPWTSPRMQPRQEKGHREHHSWSFLSRTLPLSAVPTQRW